MHIEVTPSISTHGTPITIRVSDLAPGADCRLALSTTDGTGRIFTGTYSFTADAEGCVDTATTLPQGAEWVPADDRGPLWALDCDDTAAYVTPTGPTTIEITARTVGQPGVRTQVQRRPPAHIVQVEQLPRCTGRNATAGAGAAGSGAGAAAASAAGGVAEATSPANAATTDATAAEADTVAAGGAATAAAAVVADGAGAMFTPEGSGPWPLVLVLGDATGQPATAAAMHLATLGVAACAPDWVPADDQAIDLDRLESCLRGLRRLEPCDNSLPISIVGMGRGAELALMLAAAHPDLIGPVVAHSPSDVRTAQPGTRRQPATWTSSHYPTAHITAPGIADTATDIKAFIRPDITGSPRKLVDYYRNARKASDTAAATIDISTISGPLLLTAGDEDCVWESVASMDRLHEQARAHNIEVFTATYHHCGYGVGYPFTLPASPGKPLVSLYGKPTHAGGTAAGRGHAAADSYTNTTTFLSSALGLDQYS